MARSRRPDVLDDHSKEILEQLQQDGRRPYAAIGKSVGLSETAVRQRVQRMIDNGIVQIVAVSNPLHLGFNRHAMIGINVAGDLESVADQIATMPEIDYVVVTAGSFDLLVEVVCEDDEHLLEILAGGVRRQVEFNDPVHPSSPHDPGCLDKPVMLHGLRSPSSVCAATIRMRRQRQSR